jgi:hypothetical protein
MEIFSCCSSRPQLQKIAAGLVVDVVDVDAVVVVVVVV